MEIKLRAGTNSVNVNAVLNKGQKIVILSEGKDMEIDPARLPKNIDGKLMCEGIRIYSVAELMAGIYLAGYEEASRDMTLAVLSLMSGEMKSKAFIAAYSSIEGLGFLEEIDFSEFNDEGDARTYILRQMEDILYDDYNLDVNDGIFDKFVRFAATYPRINEIREVLVSVSIDRYGSGITIYRNRINSMPGLGGFHAVSEDDPRYEDEYDKWESLAKQYLYPETKTEIFGAYDIGELVERALATGNAFEMLPKSVKVTEETLIDLKNI